MKARSVSDDKKVVVKSLVDSGMPYRKVQEVTGVSLGWITKISKEFEASRELIAWYKKNKADVLLRAQAENISLQNTIRDTMTEEDVKALTPDQRQRWFSALGVDYGIKFDKERLESGNSTENVSVIITAIQEWKRIKEKTEDA
jgi:hypothetical protein